jgi:hypothetical protein
MNKNFRVATRTDLSRLAASASCLVLVGERVITAIIGQTAAET